MRKKEKRPFGKVVERLSIWMTKKPAAVILGGIILFNILFIALTSLIVMLLDKEIHNYFTAIYFVITMILDAGCISNIIDDLNAVSVTVVILCLFIIIMGMISFTGALIGYITNWISSFIDDADNGEHRLKVSGHTVILNWNNRASEIVNDLLFCKGRQRIVILVPSNKEEIVKEINERISDTIASVNHRAKVEAEKLPKILRRKYYKEHKIHDNLTIIVREGDTFSSKQLKDISLDHAKMIIILGNDLNNSVCKLDTLRKINDVEKGNPQIVKTLIQVAEITAAETSDDNQQIVVEVEDQWTYDLVAKIIENKQKEGKCNITPVRMNVILGCLLSQFSLMPELNLAYSELFSNQGATFYPEEIGKNDIPNVDKYIKAYLDNHPNAIPLTKMTYENKDFFYYVTTDENKIKYEAPIEKSSYRIKYNYDFWLEMKNVVILGHNSKMKDIMNGFDSFRHEWNRKDGSEIINMLIIDDKKSLEKQNYYKEYSYVKYVEAEIFDKDKIISSIEEFVDSNVNDTSVLILSDDTVVNEDIDSNALANLIYVQDIKSKKLAKDPTWDPNRIDVIIELLNPRHYDIVKSYSVNNVVISNRYISKMITQIGEKSSLFSFYTDILTYDDEDAEEYESYEIYVKKVSRLFKELPGKTTVDQFVRALYHATADDDLPKEDRNPTIALGYVDKYSKVVLFEGDLTKKEIELTEDDKVIVFSAH